MLRHLDLFSGIGGFALAARMVGGYETIGFCEIEPYCQAVLRKHWPGVPIYEDVRTLSGVVCDVITGGFPCQDISVAGKGAGIDGERSGLWSEYARLIGELRPRYVLVENVSALLGRGLERVLGDLAALGYDAEWHCVPASAVGAPHIRDRIWIMAYPGHASGGQDASQSRDSREISIRSKWSEAHDFPGVCRETVADPSRARLEERVVLTRIRGAAEQRKPRQDASVGREDVGDAECVRELQPQRCEPDEWRWLGDSSWWSAEPDVGRVAHGVPARVDRLRALGNAIVPQVAAIFLQAIKESAMITRAAASPMTSDSLNIEEARSK